MSIQVIPFGPDYISIGSPALLDDIFFGAGATVCFWVETDSTHSDRGCMVAKAGASSDAGWQIYISASADGFGNANSVAFLISSTPAPSDRGVFSTPTNSFNTSTWYHVAISFDADSVSNFPNMYLNGVSQTVTQNDTAGGSYNSDAGSTLTLLHADPTRPSGLEAGLVKLEDLRIYNRILTDSEVASIHTARGTDDIINGLIGRWPMIGRSLIAVPISNGLEDISGNGNHGSSASTFQPRYTDGIIRLSRGIRNV